MPCTTYNPSELQAPADTASSIRAEPQWVIIYRPLSPSHAMLKLGLEAQMCSGTAGHHVAKLFADHVLLVC